MNTALANLLRKSVLSACGAVLLLAPSGQCAEVQKISFAGVGEEPVAIVAPETAGQERDGNEIQAKVGSIKTNATDTAKFHNLQATVQKKLNLLKKNGVGVSALQKEMDSILSDATAEEPSQDPIAALSSLSNQLDQLEKNRIEAKTINVNAITKVERAVPLSEKSATAKSASAKKKSVTVEQMVAAYSDYNGTVDGYFDQLVDEIAVREFGKFVPKRGPFIVERVRIAKKLHDLDKSKVRVDGFAQLYRRMEEIVATKDRRRLTELSTEVKYLQQQLGLNQLEGTLHRQLSL